MGSFDRISQSTWVFATTDDRDKAADRCWWKTYNVTQSQTQANSARANILRNSRIDPELAARLAELGCY